MFYKLQLKTKQAKVEREMYKTEKEREGESVEESTDCSQQEMFSLHSRSQRGCVAASPAGIPLPGPSPTPRVGNGTLSPARAHALAKA